MKHVITMHDACGRAEQGDEIGTFDHVEVTWERMIINGIPLNRGVTTIKAWNGDAPVAPTNEPPVPTNELLMTWIVIAAAVGTSERTLHRRRAQYDTTTPAYFESVAAARTWWRQIKGKR